MTNDKNFKFTGTTWFLIRYIACMLCWIICPKIQAKTRLRGKVLGRIESIKVWSYAFGVFMGMPSEHMAPIVTWEGRGLRATWEHSANHLLWTPVRLGDIPSFSPHFRILSFVKKNTNKDPYKSSILRELNYCCIDVNGGTELDSLRFGN